MLGTVPFHVSHDQFILHVWEFFLKTTIGFEIKSQLFSNVYLITCTPPHTHTHSHKDKEVLKAKRKKLQVNFF